MRALARSCIALALCLGCQQPSEEGDVKRTPKPPPPPDTAIPSSIAVSVTIDGKDASMIDAAKLSETKPDFVDGERRAWDLVSLLGEPAKRPGVKLGVSAEHGPEVLMQPKAADDELVPVLAVSRRGDVVATMVDPKAPFPEYHGRGGRLGRRGDPVPRVEGVRKIRVFIDTSK